MSLVIWIETARCTIRLDTLPSTGDTNPTLHAQIVFMLRTTAKLHFLLSRIYFMVNNRDKQLTKWRVNARIMHHPFYPFFH